jgi:cysteinyl-tRNA synthetase
MSMKYLGETLDIHTGGEDNIFPHHECEIAQSEGATGKTFVRCWMHTRHLLVEGEKMAKSKGNFYTVNDVLVKGFSTAALRYSLLAPHYRQAMNFSTEGLEAAQNAVNRLRDFRTSLKEISQRSASPAAPGAVSPAFNGLIEKTRQRFESANDDDLNISEALAAVFDFVRDANKATPSPADATQALAFLDRIDSVLNVISLVEEKALTAEEADLLAKRNAARAARDFKAADAFRAELLNRGVIVEDTPAGARWKRAT